MTGHHDFDYFYYFVSFLLHWLYYTIHKSISRIFSTNPRYYPTAITSFGYYYYYSHWYYHYLPLVIVLLSFFYIIIIFLILAHIEAGWSHVSHRF